MVAGAWLVLLVLIAWRWVVVRLAYRAALIDLVRALTRRDDDGEAA